LKIGCDFFSAKHSKAMTSSIHDHLLCCVRYLTGFFEEMTKTGIHENKADEKLECKGIQPLKD
jgi:hypothetical protein